MKSLHREWSRLSIYVLLVAFGAYSTVYPLISLERTSPNWAGTLLGAEFVISGILLIVGMTTKRRGYRTAGLIVVCIGLFTISAVVGLYGGTRVLAYSFLFGAFAMQAVDDLRRHQQKDHQEETEEVQRQLAELVKSTEPNPRADQ